MKDKIGYGRDILYKDKQVEVVLVTWPPHSRSVVHAHGTSFGLIRVLKGKVYQDVYSGKTKKFLQRLRYGKGQTINETPDLIHVMGNSSSKPAQTLHIYTPPLKMQFYEDSQLRK